MPCPPDNDLLRFLDESLPADEFPRVTAHIDGCTACQTRLDRLTQETRGVIARYKELSSVTQATPPVPAVKPKPPRPKPRRKPMAGLLPAAVVLVGAFAVVTWLWVRAAGRAADERAARDAAQ